MKAVIIFSGYNPRAVLAFVRTLEKLRVPYAIIAKDHTDDILITEYKNKVVAIRTIPELLIDDVEEKIKQVQSVLKADEYILAPSTEYLNRFLLNNMRYLKLLNCIIPLVSLKQYQKISDKQSFGKMCETHGISVPKEYKSLEEVQIPFVAKPIRYQSRKGRIYTPILIFSRKDLEDFKAKHETNDFYYQEYISGSSYYLLYYFSRSGKITKSSQKNLVQQSGGKSIIAALSSNLHNTEESYKYEQLLVNSKFRGLIMIEVKHSNNIYYMIEANPRFWGPSQLFVDQGINMFESLLLDYGVVGERKSGEPRNARYFWYGGVVESKKKGQQLAYHGYSEKQLKSDITTWMKSDIYKRPDSLEVYRKETLNT